MSHLILNILPLSVAIFFLLINCHFKVRGNWQKRVEQAEARRKEAKQKKFSKSSKSVYKNLVQSQLLPLLDRYTPYIGEGEKQEGEEGGQPSILKHCHPNDNILQLWLDVPPLSSGSLYRDNENEAATTTKNGKVIDDSPGTKRKPKRANHKNNTPNKKIHPRSHEKVTSTPDEGKGKKSNDVEGELLLCQSHFFTGSCCQENNTKSLSKKSSLKKHHQCHLFHYGRQMKTLADVLLPKKNDKNVNTDMKDILKRSAAAATRSSDNNEGEEGDGITTTNSMSMLYYIEINLAERELQTNNDNQGETENKETGISDVVTVTLSKEQCPIGSIVYASLKKYLIFDRFNGGVIIEEELQNEIFRGNLEGNNRLNIGSTSCGENNAENDPTNLPVTVLEQILEFLPDESTGILSMVCKDWYREIGKTSPALWEFLLSRRKWAKPTFDEEGGDINIFTEQCKKLFVSHKIICNIIDNTLNGFADFPTEEVVSFNTMAISKDLKENVSSCSSIRCWDDSTCIVAYEKECFLSIFKAVRDADSSLSCKQILCIRVAPFPHSRKKTCELRSFDLDEETILCCYEINGLCNWLTLVKRENLLLNSAESVLDKDAFQRFDLSRLMEDYCIAVTDGMENIISLFASQNRGLDEIEASVHGQTLTACEGHFIFLVNIFMPHEDEDDENDTRVDMMQVARAMVQFSVKKKSFTWCQLVPDDLDPIMTNTLLCSYHKPTTKTLICSSTLPSPIITINTERRRGITSTSMHGDMLESLSQQLLTDGWELSDSLQLERVALSETHVILADALIHEESESSKLVLSFLPVETMKYDKTSRIILNDVKHLLSMRVHGDYVTCIIETGSNDDEFDGQWFSEEQNQDLYVIIAHIPSQLEIYRRAFSNQNCNLSRMKMIFGRDPMPTVFAAKDQKVLISGLVLADVKTHTLPEKLKTSSKTKMKKKKKGFKNNKKDGFARGMSMRG